MAKKKDQLYHEGIGRRRSAVARVRLYIPQDGQEFTVSSFALKKGRHVINGIALSDYFSSKHDLARYNKVFDIVSALDRFAVSITTTGGGKDGQLEAVMLGAARALQSVDQLMRAPLKKEGLLTRDARIRERRKPGTGGKSRRQKQSPKR